MMNKKSKIIVLIVIIVFSASVGSLITYLYLDRIYYLEAQELSKARMQSKRVNLTFDSDTDGLIYVIKSDYPKLKNNRVLKVKCESKNQFYIERKLNANCPQLLYIAINHDKDEIGKFNIKLSFPKDDSLYPSEICIHVDVQLDLTSKKGKCQLVCSRHKDLFKIDEQIEEIELSEGECPQVYFGM